MKIKEEKGPKSKEKFMIAGTLIGKCVDEKEKTTVRKISLTKQIKKKNKGERRNRRPTRKN